MAGRMIRDGVSTWSASAASQNPVAPWSLVPLTGIETPPFAPSIHCPLLNAAFADDAHSSNIRITVYPAFSLMIPHFLIDMEFCGWSNGAASSHGGAGVND